MSHDAGAFPNHKYNATYRAVCQGKTLVEQFEAGVTLFDFRVNKGGHLVHEYALMDYQFGKADVEALALQRAVAKSGRFAILLVKSEGDWWKKKIKKDAKSEDLGPRNTSKMPFGAIFTGVYDAQTTVGQVKNKLVVLRQKSKKWATQKLQVSQVNKMNPNARETYVLMDEQFSGACPREGDDSKLYESGAKTRKLQIKASFSNTGIWSSPLCMTAGSLPAIQAAMKKLFESPCPVIISVDAAAELLNNNVDGDVKRACR